MSKTKAGLLTLAGLGAAAGCWWVYRNPEVIFFERWICGFGALVFGLGSPLAALRMFRSGPMIVIDEKGIDDRRAKIGIIPWSEISGVTKVYIQKQPFLCVRFIEPGKLCERYSNIQKGLKSINEAMGIDGHPLTFIGLDRSIDEALDCISAHIEQYQRDKQNRP